MNTVTSYMIIERGAPMDGELYVKGDLLRALPYADHDAMVIALDLAECHEDGSTPCRNVTEDVTLEAWSQLNRTEREDYAERDLFKLASRFVADEYESATRTVEAA